MESLRQALDETDSPALPRPDPGTSMPGNA
jgi:hypothetical protein